MPSWEVRDWKHGARWSLLMTPPAPLFLFSHRLVGMLCHLHDNANLNCKCSRKCLTASHPLTIQLKKMFHEVLFFLKKRPLEICKKAWVLGLNILQVLSLYLLNCIIIVGAHASVAEAARPFQQIRWRESGRRIKYSVYVHWPAGITTYLQCT